MVYARKESDVKDLGRVVYCDNAPFDVALDAVKAKGGRIITARDLAYARV